MCIVWSVCFLQMCFLCAHIINDSERYYRISLFLPFCTQLFLRSRLYVVCGLKLLCSAPWYPPQKFPYTFSPGDGHYFTTTLGEHLYTCLLKDQGENFVGNIYPDMEFLDSGECTYFIWWVVPGGSPKMATPTVHQGPHLPANTWHLPPLQFLLIWWGAKWYLIVALVCVSRIMEFEYLFTGLVVFGICFYKLSLPFAHLFLLRLSSYCWFVGAPCIFLTVNPLLVSTIVNIFSQLPHLQLGLLPTTKTN